MTPEELAAIRLTDYQLFKIRQRAERKQEMSAVEDRKRLLAHIDAITEAVRRVETAYDSVNGWHDVAYDDVTEAMYAVLALLRGTPQ